MIRKGYVRLAQGLVDRHRPAVHWQPFVNQLVKYITYIFLFCTMQSIQQGKFLEVHWATVTHMSHLQIWLLFHSESLKGCPESLVLVLNLKPAWLFHPLSELWRFCMSLLIPLFLQLCQLKINLTRAFCILFFLN